MRTEDPLAALHRRLRPHPEPDTGNDDQDGDDAVLATSWVPDGRPGRGPDWLSAVRADPGRAGAVALAVVALLAVLVTVFTLVRHRPPPVVAADLPPVQLEQTPDSPAATAPQHLVVSVVGLVQQPGLVTLAPSARVSDAVSAAGGPISGADTLGLNLARHVTDGEQIVVGLAAPAGRTVELGSSVDAPPASGPADGTAAAGPVDLNTATAEQLDALPGVGPVTAAAIVAWRTANGRFSTVDQLSEVDGIGPARLEKLRPLVRV